MSYKVLQLSPQASTGVIRARTAIQDSVFEGSWGASSIARSREFGFPPSLLEEEAELDHNEANGRILGLGLSVAFSASVWAGVALMVTRFFR